MTTTLMKLSAGSGYTYLTKQTARSDMSTKTGGQTLADYYSEKGEQPGTWLGAGLSGIGGQYGITTGETVTEDQMKALFGEGLHPNAERISKDATDAGLDGPDAVRAAQLGTPFTDVSNAPSPFITGVTRAYNEWLTQHGLNRNDPIPDTVREQIRTEVARTTFGEKFGRDPLDARELSAHIARESRPAKATVAGYDFTFSAPKSFTVLWAAGTPEQRHELQRVHEEAVRDSIAWLENEGVYTRRGKAGVRQVKTNGLLATAFNHRDNRDGDPHLHTHVAISAKVQDRTDGKWLALDGAPIYKINVPLSERYNRLLETKARTLGLAFADREGTGKDGKRAIREVAGVPVDLIVAMSSRQRAIDAKMAELVGEFTDRNSRPPSTKEAHKLHRVAHDATRAAKSEPRSLADQLQQWTPAIDRVLGGFPTPVDGGAAGLFEHARRGGAPLLKGSLLEGMTARGDLSPAAVSDLAGMVVRTVSEHRAVFDVGHLRAEVERAVRPAQLLEAAENDGIERVLAAAISTAHSVRLDARDTVVEPSDLIQDGRSVYHRAFCEQFTTAAILDAEDALLQAARAGGGRAVDPRIVDLALLEHTANGLTLNTGQAQLVREMATSGSLLQLALAPAGTGKTTAMSCLTKAWADSGGTVIGLAPSASAAEQLGASINATVDTLDKLVWHINAGVGQPPQWINAIGSDTLVLVDEAGMAGTLNLAAAVDYITSRGGQVRLIGDDQQLAAPAAGGVLRNIATDVGALTLSQVVRFTAPGEAAATLAWREGDTEALGFYLDRDRVKVGSPTQLADMVFTQWQDARADGKDALMMAHTNATVTELNGRARAARLAAQSAPAGPCVVLRSGLEASVGDVVVTRKNQRTLRLGRSDFVKNGDRWDVVEVRARGAVVVQHRERHRRVVLPATYVADHLDLGYASTGHGAQGQTVDVGLTLLTGTEDRQWSYVAVTRGRESNLLFVPVGGDGDSHQVLHPDNVVPPTAVETLEKTIRRDGAMHSAITMLRETHDPVTLLPQSVARYDDGLGYAATTVVGTERMAQITDAAERVVPGVTSAPAWETLAGHLATIELDNADPISTLQHAARDRTLVDALDVAAVLDWRLDTTGRHSSAAGPLPWLPGIPTQLREDPRYGNWLSQRADLTTHDVSGVRNACASMEADTAPRWAMPFLDVPDLHADLAVWRAAHHVPEDDTSPTGPPRPSLRERAYQDTLIARANRHANTTGTAVGARFVDQLRDLEPRVLNDPWWPTLAERLNQGHAAGRDITAALQAVIGPECRPLPDDHTAAALWSRIVPHIGHVTAADVRAGAGRGRLVATWAPALSEALPAQLAQRVMSDPAWPTLVAAVSAAATDTGWTPDHLITAAIGLIPTSDLPTPGQDNPGGIALHDLTQVILWRLGDLTTPTGTGEEETPAEEDLYDAEKEAFAATLAAEYEQSPTTNSAPNTEPRTHSAAEPSTQLVTEPSVQPAQALQHNPADQGSTPAARILDLTAAAAAYYADQYPGSPAQEHMVSRFGTTLAETEYVLGYAPPQVGRAWTTRHLVEHLRTTHGASNTELVDAGLARWNRDRDVYDLFRDRAMIAIRDKAGIVIGFNGRDLSGAPDVGKYMNTPTNAAFTKGNVLFGAYEGRSMAQRESAPRPPGVVRVEGPMDAIAITLAGQHAMIGVSTGGTAMTSTQAGYLASLAREGKVWLALDNDPAGRKATTDSYWQLLNRGIDPRTLPLTGNDPAEMFAVAPDTLKDTLQLADIQPSAAVDLCATIVSAADLDRHRDITSGVYAARRMGPIIAALPVDQWEDTIRAVAFEFPNVAADREERGHVEDMLWRLTVRSSAHWSTTFLPAATDQSDADGVRHALADLAATLAQSRAFTQRGNNAIRDVLRDIEDFGPDRNHGVDDEHRPNAAARRGPRQ